MSKSNKPPKKEMPSLLAFLFMACSAIVSTFYGMAITKTLPLYIEAANKANLSDWVAQGWILTLALLMCAFIAWYFGMIFIQCNKILQERWFS